MFLSADSWHCTIWRAVSHNLCHFFRSVSIIFKVISLKVWLRFLLNVIFQISDYLASIIFGCKNVCSNPCDWWRQKWGSIPTARWTSFSLSTVLFQWPLIPIPQRRLDPDRTENLVCRDYIGCQEVQMKVLTMCKNNNFKYMLILVVYSLGSILGASNNFA